MLPVDSPKLVENTPPLHYQCRSVLSPITEYAMEKLRAGDARYQQRHFGYLDDEFALNPPKTLDEALAGWEKAPAPQAGFGQLGATEVKPTKSTAKADSNIQRAPRDKIDFSPRREEYPVPPHSRSISPEKMAVLDRMEESGVLYVHPSAIEGSTEDVQALFPDGHDQLRQMVREQMSELPLPLLEFIERREGRIVIESSRVIEIRDGSHVAWDTLFAHFDPSTDIVRIAPEAVKENFGALHEEVVHLLDKLLGADPGELGIRFSTGDGYNENVQVLAAQMAALYNETETKHRFPNEVYNSREYFAHAGVRAFLRHPEWLKKEDANLYQWVRDVFFNEDTWRRAL